MQEIPAVAAGELPIWRGVTLGTDLVVDPASIEVSRRKRNAKARLTSQETVGYSWMLGFFWFEHHRHQPQTSGTPLGQLETIEDRRSSGWAPFLNLEWMPIEDWLQLFGGFRWNADTIDLDLENFGLAGVLPPSCRGGKLRIL